MLSFDRRSFQAKTRSSINRATITVLGSQISKNAKKTERCGKTSAVVQVCHFDPFLQVFKRSYQYYDCPELVAETS